MNSATAGQNDGMQLLIMNSATAGQNDGMQLLIMNSATAVYETDATADDLQMQQLKCNS
ncbi:hypothetical protein F511_41761 [Dorcoceras hygrometricum]|uniref:Uncharacterized protein n=1 Tax=Dorcoceras hygrometricum TaxID=472368 RepID=A0A2Z7ARX9_9LAMI|nr:hypothetical protein F511_41761 [Dorcoceras hygrometricum]